MKKKTAPKGPRNLDKHLFEAGQQCHKRLWLDVHAPATEEPPPSRQAMSEAGATLRGLARTAFPKGVVIEETDITKAAAATKAQLDAGVPVLFDAAFVADGTEARCDILVVHKDGAFDLFEIKSGTKIKHRYVNDLALQAHVVERCGHKLRAAFLLHVNLKYVHKEGADYPPMQLLRSNDVTGKVKKQMLHVSRRLQQFRALVANTETPQVPMGTFCASPFPCPHLARCSAEAPKLPLRELPELTHALELELHKEGIEELGAIDPAREGLTFRQRRTLTCLREGQPIIEPFVRTELRQCSHPLHFLAIGALTDALPRFDEQRPWRQLPYAWAAVTVHADGRTERASFVHVDRTDPRPSFVASLAKHLDCGGTILCWDDERLDGLRDLLEDLPAAKAQVRGITSRPHLDLMHLLEAAVFHPQLLDHRDLRKSALALLEDKTGADLPVFGDEELRTALAKGTAPRVRAATKEKIGADILAGLSWTAERLLDLFTKYAEIEVKAPKPKAPAKVSSKPLPKPLPKDV